MCERELLLFALVWFIIGMLDEVAVDVIWVLLRLSGRVKTPRLAPGEGLRELSGPAAVLIPAWQEADVIGTTIGSMLSGWGQRDYRLYVGCYRNDLATIAAVMRASANDSRLRLVIHDRIGQTTKADCLNRLYAALASDEARMTTRFRMVVLQDAEDMVHPEALWLLDHSLDTAEFAQLPVRPELSRGSHWVAGHYADEFAESHAKAMVVRDALAARPRAWAVHFTAICWRGSTLCGARLARPDHLPPNALPRIMSWVSSSRTLAGAGGSCGGAMRLAI